MSDPDPRPALTDAQLDEIEARARGAPNWVRVDVFSLLGEARRARAEVRHLLAVLADADWRLENCSEAERDALRDHAARLAFASEEMRRDRDVGIAECRRLSDHINRLEAALEHYADPARWGNGGYWHQHTLYEGHLFYRPAAEYTMGEQVDGGAVARAALLDPPTTTGRAGSRAPTRCEDSGVALDDPRDG